MLIDFKSICVGEHITDGVDAIARRLGAEIRYAAKFISDGEEIFKGHKNKNARLAK